jgi:hypothetical protein
MILFEIIPKAILKRMRFLAISVTAGALVLLPGAMWYKATIASVAESTAHQYFTTLNMQLVVLRQQMVTSLAVASTQFWTTPTAPQKIQVRRDLPFDLVIVYDKKHHFIDGFRTMSATNESVALSEDAAQNLVPATSSFFDRVSDKSVSAGILLVDRRPLIVAVQSLALKGGGSILNSGYAIVGRWMQPAQLASSKGPADSKFEIFTITDEESMPQDVKESIGIAQRNNGFTYNTDRSGSGFLYSLLDDISDRPALVIKSGLLLPLKQSGSIGFGIYYVVAGLVAFGVWGTLTRQDIKSRRRLRRFDGLSSLTNEHIRTLVEAFPGYAFAIKSDLTYVGISHILAGVTGQEPSYFFGHEFGALACEHNDGTLVKVFTALRDLNRWPRIDNIAHVVEGLGKRHEFTGMAHYLAKQDLLLVILSEKKNIQTISLDKTQIVTNTKSKIVA